MAASLGQEEAAAATAEALSTADVVGNGSSASATFTVEVTYRVYLPLILRK